MEGFSGCGEDEDKYQIRDDFVAIMRPLSRSDGYHSKMPQTTKHADSSDTPRARGNWRWNAFVITVVALLLPGAIIGVIRVRAARAVYLLEHLIVNGRVTGSPETELAEATEEIHQAGATAEAVEVIRKYLNHANRQYQDYAGFALLALEGDCRAAIPEVLKLYQDPKITQAERIANAQLLMKIAPDVAVSYGAVGVVNAHRARMEKIRTRLREKLEDEMLESQKPFHIQIPDEVFEQGKAEPQKHWWHDP